MKRIHHLGRCLLAWILCLCLVAGSILPAAAVTKRAVPDFIYTSLVRSSPRASAAVLGQLADGSAVSVLGESGKYYRIDCYGRDGYIAKSQVRLEEEKYYVNCVVGASETGIMNCVSPQNALLLRNGILELAQRQLGTRYAYGGMAPGGFDCSGLTSYVFRKNGYSLHRCADEQMQDGLIVSREGLQVGDLVFYRESWAPWLASHVGIYAGDGKLLHSRTGGVCYSDMDDDWYVRYYVGARRIVNVQALAVELTPDAGVDSAVSYTAGFGMRTIG